MCGSTLNIYLCGHGRITPTPCSDCNVPIDGSQPTHLSGDLVLDVDAFDTVNFRPWPCGCDDTNEYCGSPSSAWLKTSQIAVAAIHERTMALKPQFDAAMDATIAFLDSNDLGSSTQLQEDGEGSAQAVSLTTLLLNHADVAARLYGALEYYRQLVSRPFSLLERLHRAHKLFQRRAGSKGPRSTHNFPGHDCSLGRRSEPTFGTNSASQCLTRQCSNCLSPAPYTAHIDDQTNECFYAVVTASIVSLCGAERYLKELRVITHKVLPANDVADLIALNRSATVIELRNTDDPEAPVMIWFTTEAKSVTFLDG